MDEPKKEKRGGKRQGAGRPTLGKNRKVRSIFVNDKEFQQVKEFLETLKAAKQ